MKFIFLKILPSLILFGGIFLAFLALLLIGGLRLFAWLKLRLLALLEDNVGGGADTG
jgi:hypothetical protein